MIYLLSALLLGGSLLLAAEFLARFFLRRSRYYPWPPGYNMEMTFAPGLEIGGQDSVRILANRLGERGDEPPPGAYRVLAAGGSAVECYYLSHGNTWADALQRELSAPAALRLLSASRIHMGNVGKSSADSRVLQIMLGHLVRNYPEKLDCLVIMVGASDILRWFEWGTPENWEGDSSIPLAAFLELHPELEFGWKPNQLALAEIYRRLRVRRPEKRLQVGKSLLRARQFRRDSKNIIDQLTVPTDRVFTRFRQYLAACIQNGFRLAHRVVVVSQPCFTAAQYTPEMTAGFWNGSIGDPYKGEPQAFFSPRLIAELMQDLARHTGEVAASQGAPFVNLSSGVIPNNPDHYYDQFHFTPLGASVVGRVIAQAILNQNANPPDAPAA